MIRLVQATTALTRIVTMQEKGGVYTGFNIHFGRVCLDFGLGWLYVKVKVSIAKKRR